MHVEPGARRIARERLANQILEARVERTIRLPLQFIPDRSNELVDDVDEPVRLGQRDEAARLDLTQLCVRPARERLDRDDRPIGQPDDRLIVNAEAGGLQIARQRIGQELLQALRTGWLSCIVFCQS